MITIPFLDLFNTIKKSDNISIQINEPTKIGTCISGGGYYYSICQDGENINLIYRIFSSNKKIYQYEETWLSQSKDGLVFKNDRKLFKQMGVSHNFFVIDKPVNEKILAIGGVKSSVCGKVNGLHLFETNDVNKWNSASKNLVLSQAKSLNQNYATHFDSLNNIMYDKYDKTYKIYARYNKSRGNRYVQVSSSKNLKTWSQCKLVKFTYNCSNIYAPAVFQYPNSSMYISFYSQQKGAHKKTTTTSLAYSYDGTYFKNVNKSLVSQNEGPNRALSSIVEKDDKFIIYVHYIDKNTVVTYNLRKDGFGNISTGDSKKEEYVLFNPIILEDNEMKLNFKTNKNKNGYVRIELYDDDKLIEKSNDFSGNHINYSFKWKTNVSGKNISIKIMMKCADIYSMSLPINYKKIREQFQDEMKKFPISDPPPNKVSYRRKTRKKQTRNKRINKTKPIQKVIKYKPPQKILSEYPKIEFEYAVNATEIIGTRSVEVETSKTIKEIKKVIYRLFNDKVISDGFNKNNSGRNITCNILFDDDTVESVTLINNKTSNAMAKNVRFKNSKLSSTIEFEYKPLIKKDLCETIKTMRFDFKFSSIISLKYSNYNKSFSPYDKKYDETNCGRIATCTVLLENGKTKDIILIKNSKSNAVALNIKLI